MATPRPAGPLSLSPSSFARLVLVLVGVVWLGVGFAGVADPRELGDWLDFDLESNTALAEFRAMYGGLALALAFLHIAAAVRGAWLRPALLMSATITAGLLLGRLVSIGLSGMFGPVALVLAGVEVVLLVLSAVALWRLWRPAAPVAAEAESAPPPDETPTETP